MDCSPIKLHDLCKEAADRLHTFDDASNSIDQMINAPKVQTCKIVQIVIIWSSENSKLQIFLFMEKLQLVNSNNGLFRWCILEFALHPPQSRIFEGKKIILSFVMHSSISVGQPSAPGMNQVQCTLYNVF